MTTSHDELDWDRQYHLDTLCMARRVEVELDQMVDGAEGAQLPRLALHWLLAVVRDVRDRELAALSRDEGK